MAYSLDVKSVDSARALPVISKEPQEILAFKLVQDGAGDQSITTSFIDAMREFLHDPATKESYRADPSFFTRYRCFTFAPTCVALLFEHASPAQTRMLHMFQDEGFSAGNTRPTASAFFQARAKVLPSFFHDWANRAVQFFYEAFPRASLVTTWRGRKLWAIDCTRLYLPDNPETRASFSIQTNQIPDSETVLGLGSFAYDVLNDLPTDACLEKVQAEKNLLFDHHFEHFTSDIIAIYDRGYADYAVIAENALRGFDFIIRFPTSSTYKEVVDFVNSAENDVIISLHASPHYRTQVLAGVYPEAVQVRLVKFKLPGGETEVLVTSLLDRKQYKISDFKYIYGKRWGVETGFNRFKHDLKVECFSSGKVNSIQQDFHAAVFLQVLEAISSKAQDWLIRAKSIQDGLKHVYHVNKSGAYTMLTGHLVGLFLKDEATMRRHVAAFQEEIRMLKSPFRPGRHAPRKRLTPTRRLNYCQYRKKQG